MTKQEIKEKIIEKLAMAITHSKEGEYAKNEEFVSKLISSALDTAFEEGVKQELDEEELESLPWFKAKLEMVKDEVRKQERERVDGKMMSFLAKYSIDRPIPPSEIRKEWDSIINL